MDFTGLLAGRDLRLSMDFCVSVFFWDFSVFFVWIDDFFE